MKLADYQDAAVRTAEPRAFHHDYLIPGIVGETGELIGHMAKGYWHQKDVSEKMMFEYGDICWQTALLLLTEDVTELSPLHSWSWSDKAPHVDLVRTASALYDTHFNPDHCTDVKLRASHLWRLLEFHCEAVTGQTFDDVLQANLDKLASRAERGVLQGSGDHR